MPSANAVRTLMPSTTDVAWLCLLRVSAPGQETLYLVNNSEPVVSRGHTYAPFPFAVTLPADDSEQLPSVSLQITNVDQSLVEYVRAFETPPRIELELVTSAWPDVVEKALTFLKLRNVTYDAITLGGVLAVDDFLTQKYPGEGYTPPYFPSLFR